MFVGCLTLIGIGISGLSHDNAAVSTTATAGGERATGGEEEWGEDSYVALPAGVPSRRKSYEGFTLSFNKENRTPNWVGWELRAHETSGGEKRSNKFWTDETLEGCPSTADYTRSGYSRGHMCPAADQKWSSRAMEDCFVMANIVPQDQKLNSGAWGTLEDKERKWAQRDGRLIIVSGPIYEESDKLRIGSGVRVPSALFKVLYAPDVANPRAIAFVYPNMPAPGNMQNYSMSVDELEGITGYNFFPNLSAEEEKRVESVYSFRDWLK